MFNVRRQIVGQKICIYAYQRMTTRALLIIQIGIRESNPLEMTIRLTLNKFINIQMHVPQKVHTMHGN